MTDIAHLYKYGKISKYSKSLFSTPKIYLCSADKLNDPFECRPLYGFEGTKDEIVASLARGAMSRNTQFTKNMAIDAATKLYEEGRHVDGAVLRELEQNFLTMSTKRVGIYCLSEIPDSILMWSHYSDSHSGYCIEFEASDSTEVFGEAQQINYSKTYPLIEPFQMTGEQKADLAFLTKFDGWKYEREWRLISIDRGPGHYAYPAHLMKRVIFGLNATDTTKDIIRKWTSRRDSAVSFAQAVRNERTFAIDILPL